MTNNLPSVISPYHSSNKQGEQQLINSPSLAGSMNYKKFQENPISCYEI
jgi:hypothetical protein